MLINCLLAITSRILTLLAVAVVGAFDYASIFGSRSTATQALMSR